MLRLDHLTVIAPTLAEGVDHVRACLDLDIPYGGEHPEMGTHNHVLRLGDDAYMEIIAIDPNAPAPTGPRWFGLGDPAAVRRDWDAGRRLRTWVAATDSLDAVLAQHGDLFGGQTRISRGGKYSQFSLLPDGALPMDGILPSIIDRGGRPAPGAAHGRPRRGPAHFCAGPSAPGRGDSPLRTGRHKWRPGCPRSTTNSLCRDRWHRGQL